MDRITAELVDDLALGAGLLAAGGGAQPWSAAAPLRRTLAEHGPVRLVQPAALEPDDFVLPVGVLGAPAGADDEFPDGAGVRQVVRAAERRSGRRCTAVLPLDIGGMNALAAPYVAAALGLPCVDGDGSRRGFARLDLTLFTLGGLSASPVLVCDGEGNVVMVEAPDNRAAHRLARAAVSGMGGLAMISAYPMTARECVRTAAAGSVSYCLSLGRMTRTLRGSAVPGVLSSVGARLLFTGRVVHVARGETGSPACSTAVRGTVTVESLAEPTRTVRVDFQQGILVLSEDGVVSATVPDLISIVDAETWVPAHTARLAPAQRVHVLVIPAHERWHSNAGLAAAGPREFGYDIDYEPLEQPSSGPWACR